MISIAGAMAESPETPPRAKRAKRQYHFSAAWSKEYPGITKSRKGKHFNKKLAIAKLKLNYSYSRVKV